MSRTRPRPPHRRFHLVCSTILILLSCNGSSSPHKRSHTVKTRRLLLMRYTHMILLEYPDVIIQKFPSPVLLSFRTTSQVTRTLRLRVLPVRTDDRCRYLLNERETMDGLKVWLKLRATFNGETNILHQTSQYLKHFEKPYSPNVPSGMLGYIDQLLHILKKLDTVDPLCEHHVQ
jgi:hypothetical protein